MAKGVSLHIGLNRIDPDHYEGLTGVLRGCENDANDMGALAAACGGYQSTCLLTEQATADRVLAAIDEAARTLESGDLFLLTYSGHGGQVPDTNNDEEKDARDETWVLYDRMLVDDELYAKWATFRAGVHIFVLSDSCHSGTMLKAMDEFAPHLEPMLPRFGVEETPQYRALPAEVQLATYETHKSLYDGLQAANPKGDRVEVGASVLLISGCQDNQTSADGAKNGLFTSKVLEVWDSGKFEGNYQSFSTQIKSLLPPWQSPNYYQVGRVDSAFERQKPFVIGEPVAGRGSAGAARCRLTLDMDSAMVNAMSEDQLRQLLQTEGCPSLLDAYRQAKGTSGSLLSGRTLTRDGEFYVEGHVDSQGGASVITGLRIRF